MSKDGSGGALAGGSGGSGNPTMVFGHTFVQIAGNGEDLYALDSNGLVWVYQKTQYRIVGGGRGTIKETNEVLEQAGWKMITNERKA